MRTAVDIVRGYLAAFERADAEEITAFVADGFVNEHLSELGSGCAGRNEYRRRLGSFLTEFAGVRYAVDDVVTQELPVGAAVVARYRLEATHDGVDVEIPGVMWFTVVGGEITRRTDLWDSLTFLRQTGGA